MPALDPKGRDLALQSLADGRVDTIWGPDGNPVFADTQEWRVTSLLVSRLGEWWADPTGRRGSQLHKVKGDRKQLTVSQLQTYAGAALRPAQDAGFIVLIQLKATRLGTGKFQLLVSWKNQGGQVETRRYIFQN